LNIEFSLDEGKNLVIEDDSPLWYAAIGNIRTEVLRLRILHTR